MAEYSVAEAKNNLPKLLDRALAGECVTITRRGKPIARIEPIDPEPQAMSIDVDWLESVRVNPRDPDLDFTAIIRDLRDAD
ncbi:MAG TPA: type II toxin-antitoxin system prevent-host-death family antitoxin [Caulobacteraceae bacterium]|nr:type II toxin-antitoxin system prevent-host-death family antitoxin [Caulobacteraceae bacterium]